VRDDLEIEMDDGGGLDSELGTSVSTLFRSLSTLFLVNLTRGDAHDSEFGART